VLFRSFISVGLSTNGTNGGLTLSDGVTYYVTVRGANGAGLTSTASSDGVIVDTTPPAAGAVNDGPGADINLQSSATTISANWTAWSDAQSGVTGYEWAIGIAPGGTTVQGFTAVGLSTNATNSALALANGATYYITVRGANGVGLTSTASSNGVTIDTTPPVVGAVNDGPGADISQQSSATTISANWTAWSDAQSGVTGYEWAIGTSAGGVDIQAYTSVGLSTSATNGALALSGGATYYVTVRGTNGAGGTSTASSNGVTVDATPPVAGAVNDGPGADIDAQTSTTTISSNWTAWTDAQSGVTGYEWAIGTYAGGVDIQAYTSVGASTSATNGALALSSGTAYYVTVRGTNGVGLTSTASSDGVTVDTTPPVVGVVNDGAGADIDAQASTTTISANWTAWGDPQSGIAGYEWAIGTSAGGVDIQAYTSVGASTDATNSALALSSGTTYYVTVRGTNGVGLTSTASSDGVGIENSPPVAGAVNDGSGADITWQSSITTISANWTAWSDPERDRKSVV
jgi:hypothetical protein